MSSSDVFLVCASRMGDFDVWPVVGSTLAEAALDAAARNLKVEGMGYEDEVWYFVANDMPRGRTNIYVHPPVVRGEYEGRGLGVRSIPKEDYFCTGGETP